MPGAAARAPHHAAAAPGRGEGGSGGSGSGLEAARAALELLSTGCGSGGGSGAPAHKLRRAPGLRHPRGGAGAARGGSRGALAVGVGASCLAGEDPEINEGAATPEDEDDSEWMQSPRKRRSGSGRHHPSDARAQGGGTADACAPAADGGAVPHANGVAKGAASDGKGSDEEGVIRVGPEYQAVLPEWRPRPEVAAAGAGVQSDLLLAAATAFVVEARRMGLRGPLEAQAVEMAIEVGPVLVEVARCTCCACLTD
jgi:hypothetical protein